MNITPVAINGILGTLVVSTSPFIELQIRTLYRAIRHTQAGVNSIAKWIFHGYKRYYQSFLLAHMNREAKVWVKFWHTPSRGSTS